MAAVKIVVVMEDSSQAVVLLHGFGATRRSWEGVTERLEAERYRPLALDLPGHGTAGAMRPISFDTCVAHVLAAAPPRFALAGYSLGGRIALHVALAAPARISRLVLVSTSAGIEDARKRAARRASDRRLAQDLERGDYEGFIARWRRQPLFAGDPPEVARAAAADQRRNRPENLARALRGIGAGEMTPLWSRLGKLTMPAIVLVGERDVRYRELGRRLARTLGQGELRVVTGGHALLLENPGAVADALRGAIR
jgi:2-succinyl-6-hydroxy-2,4-cyclohexadiene-1-carboxylate synthase